MIHMAAQRHHRALIAARRAAQAQLNTARIERVERAELLGNHQRGVVRQHHAAGAQAQRGGIGGEIANQYRRRGAGDAGHIVMFRQPVAVVAALLGEAG